MLTSVKTRSEHNVFVKLSIRQASLRHEPSLKLGVFMIDESHGIGILCRPRHIIQLLNFVGA